MLYLFGMCVCVLEGGLSTNGRSFLVQEYVCLYSEYNDGLYDVVTYLLRFIRQLRKVYITLAINVNFLEVVRCFGSFRTFIRVMCDCS